MRTFDRWRMRLRSLTRRDRVEQELDEEMRFHLDELARRKAAEGLTPAEARAAAMREFGGYAQAQELCRDQRRTWPVEDFVRDLSHGARLLARSPGFTAVALLSLALGIGANTAVFSLLESVMLRELPVREPGALVHIVGVFAGTDKVQGSYSYPAYEWLRANAPMFSHVFTWRFQRVWAGEGDGMEWIASHIVSGDYFSGLGASPLVGRTLGEERAQPAVVVLSYRWWRGRFGGDPAVLGRQVRLAGIPFTVAGVMPETFEGPEVGQAPEIYIPFSAYALLSPDSKMPSMRNASWLPLMARLRDGVSLGQASAGFAGVWRGLKEAAGPQERNTGRLPEWFATLTGELRPAASGISWLRRGFRKPLLVLMAVVAVVLLIACVNLSNYLLARAVSRQREIALRRALGASNGRLLRQMLTESLLLAVAGAALGLLFAQWSGRLLVALLSTGEQPVALDVRANAAVMAYTAALAILATLLFGLAPAIRVMRRQLNPLLQSGGRIGGAQGGSRALLVIQVALSLLLTFGATLFLATFRNLLSVDAGFDASRVLIAEVQPVRAGIRGAAAAQFYRELPARLMRIPGVSSATLAEGTPIRGCCWWEKLDVEGDTSGQKAEAYLNNVAPGYFQTLGTRLVLGRDFNERDTLAGPAVAIVNEGFARRFFPKGDALGRVIALPPVYNKPRMQIVGVVADARWRDLRSPVRLSAYFPVAQAPDVPDGVQLMVRTSGPPAALAAAVRRAVHETDRSIPVSTRTLSEELNDTLTYDRLMALLSGFFGLTALALAAVGIYGVVAYSVSRRTSEIGVRMALGASRARVLWLVMRQSAVLAAAGIAVGCAASLYLARFVESLLFGVTAGLSTLGAAVAVLAAVAAAGAWIPARRAASIDPVAALRCE